MFFPGKRLYRRASSRTCFPLVPKQTKCCARMPDTRGKRRVNRDAKSRSSRKEPQSSDSEFTGGGTNAGWDIEYTPL